MSKLLATDIVNKYSKILIVGMGWLGEPLGLSLQNSGFDVKGLVRSEESSHKLKNKGLSVTTYALPREFSAELPYTESFDLAIVAIPPGIRGGRELNKIGFESLSAALASLGIPKLILISSTGIYSDAEKEVDEETPADELSGLHTMENCFKSWGKNLSIIRFAGLIGPNRYPGRFFSGKTDVADPDTPVNLIHLDDCIGIIETIISHEAFGFIFNGVIPHHPTRKDFYRQAAKWAGMPLPEFAESGKISKRINSVNLSKILHYTLQHADVLEATRSILDEVKK